MNYVYMCIYLFYGGSQGRLAIVAVRATLIIYIVKINGYISIFHSKVKFASFFFFLDTQYIIYRYYMTFVVL